MWIAFYHFTIYEDNIIQPATVLSSWVSHGNLLQSVLQQASLQTLQSKITWSVRYQIVLLTERVKRWTCSWSYTGLVPAHLPHALNSVLCRYVWSSEAWLRSWATQTCNECRRRTLNRKEQLRHRAVFLRQHGFLVFSKCMPGLPLLCFRSMQFLKTNISQGSVATSFRCHDLFITNFLLSVTMKEF